MGLMINYQCIEFKIHILYKFIQENKDIVSQMRNLEILQEIYFQMVYINIVKLYINI